MKANLCEYVISHDRKGFSSVIHLMIMRVEDYSRLPRGITLLNPEGKNRKWRVRLREGDAVMEVEPGGTCSKPKAQAAPEAGYRPALTVSLAP